MSARPKVVVITGASSGFGNLTARALAEAGHIVYAGMRATTGRNAPAVAALAQVEKDRGVRITAVEMDVQKQESVDAAVDHVMAEQGRIDVVVHNAGVPIGGR
ncbi:SDR family NAD(P)-dependent oxidoreductase [Streptomyces kaniharaensis]|uniref:SDR family NAD(P)-dependent oxidoreductase n=1 Tax=Streptomyces kaniharaensis TaxID=212423 RepID=UPI002DDD7E12|nr:SDR family NAD(P)-dependent oxidoreductase [Streptomyces kaniharaensis]